MIKKLFSYIPAVIAALFLLWIALSWVDIVADKCTARPVHSAFNFFNILAEGATI